MRGPRSRTNQDQAPVPTLPQKKGGAFRRQEVAETLFAYDNEWLSEGHSTKCGTALSNDYIGGGIGRPRISDLVGEQYRSTSGCAARTCRRSASTSPATPWSTPCSPPGSIVDFLHPGSRRAGTASAPPTAIGRIVLVTCHRRENFGAGIHGIADALQTIVEREDVAIVLPLRPNPNVADVLSERLSSIRASS